jgi:hypothetical protein
MTGRPDRGLGCIRVCVSGSGRETAVNGFSGAPPLPPPPPPLKSGESIRALVTPVLGDAPAIVGNAPPNESGCRLRPLPLPPVVVVGFSSAIYLVKKSSRSAHKMCSKKRNRSQVEL